MEKQVTKINRGNKGIVTCKCLVRVSLLSELYHAKHSSSDMSCDMFLHHSQWLLQGNGIKSTSGKKKRKQKSCYCWLSISEF